MFRKLRGGEWCSEDVFNRSGKHIFVDVVDNVLAVAACAEICR